MPDHVVAFAEKLLKTIATICAIFSLKYTKNRLVAGLCLDPLGSRPPSHNMGPTSKRRGGEKRGEEGGKEVEREGKRRERRGGKGKGLKPTHTCHHHHVGLLCNDKPQCSTNKIPVTNNINVQIRQKMSIGLLKQHMSGYGAALH